MSETLLHIAEAMYTAPGERVDFNREMFGMSYGRSEDGYFVFNTGNATRDAVASVFLNEVGIDNFSNAITAARGGEYGRATRQALFGVTQAALVLIPGVNVAYGKTRGALLAARVARSQGGIARALGSRLLQVPRNAKYALSRAGEQATVRQAVASLIPRYGSTARQLREGRRLGIAPSSSGTWGNIAGKPSQFQNYMDAPTLRSAVTGWTPTGPVAVGGSTPRQLARAESLGLVNPPGTNTRALLANANQFPSGLTVARPPAIPLRPAQQMRQQRAAVREGIQGTRNYVPTPGSPTPPPIWRQRLNYSVGRSPIPEYSSVFPGTGFPASPLARAGTRGLQAGIGVYAYNVGDRVVENRRSIAAADELAQQASAGNAEAAATDEARRTRVDQEISDALAEIQPGGAGDQQLEALVRDRNASLGAIGFQYDRAVKELQSMYQLSETDDEKERLRFMLADIQAQAEAGREAINNVFERKRKEVSTLTEKSRENTLKSAQNAFDLYSVSAGQLKDMLEADRQKVAQEVTGFGAATPRDQSEYVQLLSAMAPVAQQSRQAIGDINTEGLEWLGSVMGEQSASRQADLQRLSSSTRAAAISQHMQGVDARVNAERMALAQAVSQMRQRQASEAGAMQRASLGQSQDQQLFSPVDVQAIVESAVTQTGSPARAVEQYRIYIAGKPNPLGGVYPQEPPQFVLDAIRRAATEYAAAMDIVQRENAYNEQQLARDEEALGIGRRE